MNSLLTRYCYAPILLSAGVLWMPGHAFAVAAQWQVGRVSGQAWVNAAATPQQRLAAGMAVAPGVTITTGDRARVMLVRGTESMVIGPKSVIAVSEHPTEGLSTTVLEKVGSVTFDVERRNVQHFSVETPMLAAVVKGTHFTVNVGRRDGRVSVDRGTVEVTSLATGQRTDVTIGQRANVGSRGLSVTGAGRHDGIVQGPPRAAVVAPVAALSPASMVSAAEFAAVATVAAPAAVATAAAAATPAAAAPASPSSAGTTSQTTNSSPGQNSRSVSVVATSVQVATAAVQPSKSGLLGAVASALGLSNGNSSTTAAGGSTTGGQTASPGPGQTTHDGRHRGGGGFFGHFGGDGHHGWFGRDGRDDRSGADGHDSHGGSNPAAAGTDGNTGTHASDGPTSGTGSGSSASGGSSDGSSHATGHGDDGRGHHGGWGHGWGHFR